MQITNVYDKNQHCLLLMPEIISLFRKQYFFQGSKKMTTLINNLDQIMTSVLEEEVQINRQELSAILKALLNAQQNRDYILIADILEGDLQPSLQKLQLEFLKIKGVSNYWRKNLASLKKAHNRLYNILLTYKQTKKEKYQLLPAINGQMVVKVRNGRQEYCMHSTVNPEWEAKILTEDYIEEEQHKFIVFGMGMGYHIKALLNADSRNHVTVLENEMDILYLTFKYTEWETYLLDKRLKIVYNSDL